MENFWYIIKVLPGKERILRDQLNEQISLKKINNIIRFVCPTESTVVVVNKKKIIKEKVIYSGYLYFETHEKLTEDELKVISLINGVMTFNGDKLPKLMLRSDIEKIIVDDKLEKFRKDRTFVISINDIVLITDGAFKGFEGKVVEILDHEYKIEIEIFGRVTIVDINKELTQRKIG